MNEDLAHLTNEVIQFRDERGWKQFHTLKDNSLSILIEASELAEAVRWKEDGDVSDEALSDELADVLYWTLLTAHDRGINLADALRSKLAANAVRYPVDQAFGNFKKYDQL